jgi:acyl carrier protein
MQPDTTKLWTIAEIRVAVGKILAESLGVDEATIEDDASLVRDLGAESIDFLDISFKCQQTFGVDLPARLIQEQIVEWRGLGVLAKVVQERYGVVVAAEELRTIAPATIAAILQQLAAKHSVERQPDDDRGLAAALAARLLSELDGMGLDLSELKPETLATHLLENLHSPIVMDEVLHRFTVRALVDYLAAQLGKASRLANGA